MFAELAIMKMALEAGWSARWVGVYYLKNKEPYYLTDWHDILYGFQQTSRPLDEKDSRQKNLKELMSKIDCNSMIVNARTANKKIKPYSGCWDILADRR